MYVERHINVKLQMLGERCATKHKTSHIAPPLKSASLRVNDTSTINDVNKSFARDRYSSIIVAIAFKQNENVLDFSCVSCFV